MASVDVNSEKLVEINKEAGKKTNRPFPYVLDPFQFIWDRTPNLITEHNTENSQYEKGDRGFLGAYRGMGTMIARPLLDVPFVNFGNSLFTMQTPEWPQHCRIMERDYWRCLSRVGLQNEERFCRIYRDDVMECAQQKKSAKRRLFMDRMRREKKMAPLQDPQLYVKYTPF